MAGNEDLAILTKSAEQARRLWGTPVAPCMAAYSTCMMLPDGITENLHEGKLGAEHVVSHYYLGEDSLTGYVFSVRRTKDIDGTGWHPTCLIEAEGQFPDGRALFELDGSGGIFTPWTTDSKLVHEGQIPQQVALAVFKGLCRVLAMHDYDAQQI